jgi:hypothetical protein
LGKREVGWELNETIRRGRLPWEKEKEAGSRTKNSEEPECLGKKRRRQDSDGQSQTSQISLGKREGGWKENEPGRRARLAWEKEKEVERRMKQSEEPDSHGTKRKRLEAE